MPWGFYCSFAAGAQQGVDWRFRRILKTSLAGAKGGQRTVTDSKKPGWRRAFLIQS